MPVGVQDACDGEGSVADEFGGVLDLDGISGSGIPPAFQNVQDSVVDEFCDVPVTDAR